MAKFKITYSGQQEKTEEVEADDFIDEDPWITFRTHKLGERPPIQQVLRIRAGQVKRIDKIKG